jgi:flagellar protein FlbD
VATKDGAVITLTRLSGQRFALNADLMERIEATPDTVITLVDGSRHVVSERVEEVVDRIRHFRASVVAMSQQLESQQLAAEQVSAQNLRSAADAHVHHGTSTPLRLVAHSGGEG